MISAIVLAAGAGLRFGGTKQVADVRGKPLAQYAVDAAAKAGADEIVIVLGHDAERVRSALRLPSCARVVMNPAYATGMASSLAVGLRAADPASEAAVILLADQPGIRSDHVWSLGTVFQDTGEPILRIKFRDGPGPAILARSVWPELTKLTGDAGARVLFDADPERVRWIAIDEDAPTDVDVPEDLERVKSEAPRPFDRGASDLQLGREGLAVEDDRHPEAPV